MLFVHLRDEVEVHVDRILTGKVRSLFCKDYVLCEKKCSFNATQQ